MFNHYITNRINAYRSSGLAAVKMTEDRNIVAYKLRLHK